MGVCGSKQPRADASDQAVMSDQAATEQHLFPPDRQPQSEQYANPAVDTVASLASTDTEQPIAAPTTRAKPGHSNQTPLEPAQEENVLPAPSKHVVVATGDNVKDTPLPGDDEGRHEVTARGVVVGRWLVLPREEAGCEGMVVASQEETYKEQARHGGVGAKEALTERSDEPKLQAVTVSHVDDYRGVVEEVTAEHAGVAGSVPPDPTQAGQLPQEALGKSPEQLGGTGVAAVGVASEGGLLRPGPASAAADYTSAGQRAVHARLE